MTSNQGTHFVCELWHAVDKIRNHVAVLPQETKAAIHNQSKVELHSTESTSHQTHWSVFGNFLSMR